MIMRTRTTTPTTITIPRAPSRRTRIRTGTKRRRTLIRTVSTFTIGIVIEAAVIVCTGSIGQAYCAAQRRNLRRHKKVTEDLDGHASRVPSHLDGRALGRNLSGCRVVRKFSRSEEHTSELQSPCNLVC